MRLKRKARQEVTAVTAGQYRGAAKKEKRARLYDEKVVTALLKLWRMMDYICGKRLQPIVPELVVLGACIRKNQLA